MIQQTKTTATLIPNGTIIHPKSFKNRSPNLCPEIDSNLPLVVKARKNPKTIGRVVDSGGGCDPREGVWEGTSLAVWPSAI